MPIDHFSYSDNRTFNLRYLVNQTFWKKGGPIFFYCGNEGDIEMFAQNTGFMWDNAPNFNAMVIFAEHRYYGKTQPFGNQSYANLENLGKLSSEQALADYAVLLRYIKSNTTGAANSPVIAFGGSYGGMLAAWFRIKYPHVIVGALASSAPILQFQGLTPCWTFPAIVTRTFKNSGPGCDTSIQKSWSAIREKAKTDAGRTWLSTNFRLCPNSFLNKSEDAQGLIDWLNGGWSYLAMIDYPYPTNFLNPVPGWPVKAACKYLNYSSVGKNPEALLTGIFQAISVYQNYTGTKQCFSLVEQATSSLGTDGWDFQACTEMVMPMCQNGTDMFEPSPWNLTQYIQQCASAFYGVKSRPNWATTNYGGNMLQWASNIIFSNGNLDPWSGGGVTQAVEGADNSLHYIMIPEAAHHLDLRGADPGDTVFVKRARVQEVSIINQWIQGLDTRCAVGNGSASPSPFTLVQSTQKAYSGSTNPSNGSVGISGLSRGMVALLLCSLLAFK